jgi:hypothetical protein
MSSQDDLLEFTHVALLFSLGNGPVQAQCYCPEGNAEVMTIIVAAAEELQTMGLISIAGDSLATFQYSLTHQGKQILGELASGLKPDAAVADEAQNPRSEPSLSGLKDTVAKTA